MATQPRWLTEDEQHLWRLILAASKKVNNAIDERLQETAAMSAPEFSILVVLSEAPERTMRLRELCAELQWDRSRASHQVTRMEKRGLVLKKVCPGDARGVLVTITDEGFTRLESAVPDHVETVRRLIFDQLTDEQRHVLQTWLNDVIAVDPRTPDGS